MRFIALAALALSVSAFATDFRYTYMGRGIGTTTYYTCSAAEGILEQHLETMGMTQVRVRCTGGLESWGNRWTALPIHLSASFTNPESVRTVRLASRAGRDTGCDFNTTLIKQLVRSVGGTILSRQESCMGGSGRWSYEVRLGE